MNAIRRQTLTREQLSIIRSLHKVCIVDSVPGSGKTLVIAHRALYAVKNLHIAANRILALTFNTKAAKQIADRVRSLSKGKVMLTQCFTFHAFCNEMLRERGEKYEILDQYSQAMMLQRIKKKLGLGKTIKTKHAKGYIDQVKLAAEDGIPEKPKQPGRALALWQIYIAYEKELKRCGYKDFSDLIRDVMMLIRGNAGELIRARAQFGMVLVDELQDVSTLQAELVRLLSTNYLTAVGDTDQSIYSWRGAAADAFAILAKGFPKAVRYSLTKNQRSRATIVHAAAGFIAHNLLSSGMPHVTDNPEGPKIIVYGARDVKKEAQFIAKSIKRLWKEKGCALSSMAVIARQHKVLKAIGAELEKQGTPVDIVQDSKAIGKDTRLLLGCLRSLHNPNNDALLEEVLAMRGQRIKEKTLQKIKARAKQKQCSYYAAIRSLAKETTPSKSIAAFHARYRRWVKLASKPQPIELAEMICRNAKLGHKALEPLRPVMERNKWIRGILDNFSLSHHELGSQNADAVSLLTSHAAKGMEFETVFLPGWEDGLFPDHRALLKGGKKLEEERRLAYVSLTRAEKRICITYTGKRRGHDFEEVYPSTFLRELPADTLTDRSNRRILKHPALEDRNRKRLSDIEAGDIVSHNKMHGHGYGTVQKIEGKILTIKFHDGVISVRKSKVTKV